MRPATAWVVVYKDNRPCLSSLSYLRKDSIRRFMALWGKTSDGWRKMRERGCRCVRVEIKEIIQ